MPKQRIALRAKHLASCFDACERDATFLGGFSKTRDLFALHARDHERSRSLDDVSAQDIEAQMFRLYFFATVGARMQSAAAALKERFLGDSTAQDAVTEQVALDEQPDAAR